MRDYLHLRFDEMTFAEKTLYDLRIVGPDKPLSYEPVLNIINFGETTPEAMIEEAQARNLCAAVHFGPVIFGRALYIWDEKALTEVLEKNREILEESGWPTDTARFVQMVNQINVPERTPLYNVIADAFGNHLSPVRYKPKVERKRDAPRDTRTP